MTASLGCWNCGASLDDIPRPISRHANCSACFEVLHCCRMCRHYTPEKRPYCDHERAEPPVEKESANFCDYFKPANRFSEKELDRSDQAKSDLDALFGGGDPAESVDVESLESLEEDETLNKLKNLFDD